MFHLQVHRNSKVLKPGIYENCLKENIREKKTFSVIVVNVKKSRILNAVNL